jgi:hypothetical protein
MIDPIRDRLEEYSHIVTTEELSIILPIKQILIKKSEELNIENFKNVFPIEKY